MRWRLARRGFYLAISILAICGTSTASAGCSDAPGWDQGKRSGWPTRVENSANAQLRSDYAAGKCQWLKGEHGGGAVPRDANGDTHVTVVRADHKVCHVFKKKADATYNPTTC